MLKGTYPLSTLTIEESHLPTLKGTRRLPDNVSVFQIFLAPNFSGLKIKARKAGMFSDELNATGPASGQSGDFVVILVSRQVPGWHHLR